MIKWAIRLVILLVALVALAIAAVIFAVDPNDFKDDIQKTIKDKANLDLRFAGPLSWKFFPSLSIQAQKLSLHGLDSDEVVVGIDDASLGVKVKTVISALTGGKEAIDFDDVVIDGLLLNLIEDKDGELNIVKIINASGDGSSDDDKGEDGKDDKTKSELNLNLPNVLLTNSMINYSDKNKQSYKVDVATLELQKPSLSESFGFKIDGRVRDDKELDVLLKTSAAVKLDFEQQEYQISDLDSLVTLQKFQDGNLSTNIKTPRIVFNQAKNQLNTQAISVSSELLGSPSILKAELQSQGLHVNLDSQKVLTKGLTYTVDTQGLSPQNISAKGSIATLAVNLEQLIVDLQTLDVNARIGGVTKEVLPLEFAADKLSYAVNASSLSLSGAILKALGVNADLNISKAVFGDKQNISGNVATNTFDLSSVMSRLGQKIDLPNGALKQAKLSTAFNYTGDAVSLSNIKALLDSTNINGSLAVKNFDAPNITTVLNINSVDLNRYIKSSGSSNDSSAGATRSKKTSGNSIADASKDTSPLLPLEDLRKLKVDAKLKVGSIIFEKQRIDNFNCSLNGNGSSIKLSSCAMQTLGGTLQPSLNLGLAANPTVQGSLSASGFKLEKLGEFVTDKTFATGDAKMNVSFNTSGNSKSAWLTNNKTNAKVNLNNVVIKSMNLSNILNEKLGTELNQILTSQLEKNNIKVPLSDSKDTKIERLVTEADVNGPTVTLKEMTGTLNNDDKLRGTGSFNIVSNDFDAQLKVQVAKHKNHPYLAGIEWPLRCNGNINGSPASWCGVDQVAMQGIFKNVAVNASKAKARELLEKKLGVTLDPNKSLDKAAQEEISKRANEKIEEQKKKLGDKLNEEVGDKLNKALGGFLGR